MKHPLFPLLLAGMLAYAVPAYPEAPDAPTIEQLWQIIQAQQAEIDALKKQQTETEKAANDAEEKAEAAVVAVEETKSSSVGSWVDKTTIGGYGELDYNNGIKDSNGDDYNEIDLHRFVLTLGYEFTDSVRFFSEVELEHDGEEVEVEQAYVEFDLKDNLQTRGGVFLLPVGILNETHEPTTYYGVERNDVETIIIPSTWWAGGAGINGYFDNGISWNLALTEGLKMDTTGSNAFRVRSGRQKTAEADANDLAYTGRLKYTGIPGLELATSINYQTDASQVSGDGLDEGILYEAHAIYEHGPFALRALYAQWDFDGSAVKANGNDDQSGWYVEPSYKPWEKLGVYARYEDVDAELNSSRNQRFDQWEVGANYWPIEDVVLKVDYRSRDYDSTNIAVSPEYSDFDAFDLGIGYQF
ncbi:MAG TPA: porin [Gammaproteobacteria bacterium]|nr:porin [Gammaproteobacteria bacterium]